MSGEIKIGLIGAGRIGKLHGDNLVRAVSGVKVEALAELMLNDDHKKWAEQLGIKKVYKDPVEIMKDKEIDAVFICSSTDTHAKFIIEAAQAGKHIFCEKPIDTDVKIIKDALEAVKKAGVKLQVGFVRRFDHNHKKVRDTVASGKLGKPHIVKITSRDPEGPPLSYIAAFVFFLILGIVINYPHRKKKDKDKPSATDHNYGQKNERRKELTKNDTIDSKFFWCGW
jgi:myo-inositol 2-dehydrogenase/D-chiro-inositol 1-dehydrogenase